MVSIKIKQYGVTWEQITGFTPEAVSYARHIPGWRKNSGTVTIQPWVTPQMFFNFFYDIGQIQAIENK